jgi:hypothetical protein
MRRMQGLLDHPEANIDLTGSPEPGRLSDPGWLVGGRGASQNVHDLNSTCTY